MALELSVLCLRTQTQAAGNSAARHSAQTIQQSNCLLHNYLKFLKQVGLKGLRLDKVSQSNAEFHDFSLLFQPLLLNYFYFLHTFFEYQCQNFRRKNRPIISRTEYINFKP